MQIASVYAGSRNSYRRSPCGLSPLLVNGKSGISTVFLVFLTVFIGFWLFSTTFAPIRSDAPHTISASAASRHSLLNTREQP
jgi:hypothetical protein